MKLLTVEEVEEGGGLRLQEWSDRAEATIKAACERLAQVEPCPHCGSPELVNDNDCPECSGAGRWENWQAALRSLGEAKDEIIGDCKEAVASDR